MSEWVYDENNNRCSVEHFGSLAVAKEALASLINCKNCVNCDGCVDCSNCHTCVECTGCSHCWDSKCCTNCYTVYNSEDCVDSAHCRDSENLVDCCDNSKVDMSNVPAIIDLWRIIYDKTVEGGLDMDNFHTCDTVHCIAGWATHLSNFRLHGSEVFSAMMVFKASGYPISPVRFFEDYELATYRIKQLHANNV